MCGALVIEGTPGNNDLVLPAEALPAARHRAVEEHMCRWTGGRMLRLPPARVIPDHQYRSDGPAVSSDARRSRRPHGR